MHLILFNSISAIRFVMHSNVFQFKTIKGTLIGSLLLSQRVFSHPNCRSQFSNLTFPYRFVDDDDMLQADGVPNKPCINMRKSFCYWQLASQHRNDAIVMEEHPAQMQRTQLVFNLMSMILSLNTQHGGLDIYH